MAYGISCTYRRCTTQYLPKQSVRDLAYTCTLFRLLPTSPTLQPSQGATGRCRCHKEQRMGMYGLYKGVCRCLWFKREQKGGLGCDPLRIGGSESPRQGEFASRKTHLLPGGLQGHPCLIDRVPGLKHAIRESRLALLSQSTKYIATKACGKHNIWPLGHLPQKETMYCLVLEQNI